MVILSYLCLLFHSSFSSPFSFPPFPHFPPSPKCFLLNPPYPSRAFPPPLYFSLSPSCLLLSSPVQTPCRKVGHGTTRRTWCQRDGWRGGRRPKGLLGNSLLRTHPLGILESLAQGMGTALDGPPPPHPGFDCCPPRQLIHCLPCAHKPGSSAWWWWAVRSQACLWDVERMSRLHGVGGPFLTDCPLPRAMAGMRASTCVPICNTPVVLQSWPARHRLVAGGGSPRGC